MMQVRINILIIERFEIWVKLLFGQKKKKKKKKKSMFLASFKAYAHFLFRFIENFVLITSW